MNKPLLCAAALVCALSLSAALAEGDKPLDRPATPTPATPETPETPGKEAPLPHSQQNRMKVCNAEAGKKSLKGEERKAFMKTCLKR